MNIPKAIIMFIVAILATVGLLSIIYSQTRTAPTQAPTEPSVAALRTVFVVRHAETDPDAQEENARNPKLTEQGQLRAAHLATMLSDQELSAVFVTDTRRSLETATPTATTQSLAPTKYPPTDMESLVKSIHQLPASSPVLVVAHSNTVPMILEAFGAGPSEDLHHDEFDRFFAIVLNDASFESLIELRY
jgi:broad specificity phosphatase PhoE